MSDLRKELERLIEEWRDHSEDILSITPRSKPLLRMVDPAKGAYLYCARTLEQVLRRTAAAEMTQMAEEDGEL